MAAAGATAAAPVSGEALVATIGAPQPVHVEHAAKLLRSLPESVRLAAHEPEGAAALLFALLLHEGDAATAERQQAEIAAFAEESLDRVRQLAAEVAPLGAAVRLPLVDLLLPALRELSPDQRKGVYACAKALVAADGRTDVFELALLNLLRRQLASGEPGQRRGDSLGTAIQSFKPLRAEVELVLSGVAWSGAPDESTALAAFDAGRAKLPDQVSFIGLRAREAVTVDAVDDALGRLREASPAIRRRFLHACATAVTRDRRVFVQEVELLRAVAEAVECPMPLVGDRQSSVASRQ